MKFVIPWVASDEVSCGPLWSLWLMVLCPNGKLTHYRSRLLVVTFNISRIY
jgi:hypothetical protein